MLRPIRPLPLQIRRRGVADPLDRFPPFLLKRLSHLRKKFMNSEAASKFDDFPSSIIYSVHLTVAQVVS
jgi:hypothetical protein